MRRWVDRGDADPDFRECRFVNYRRRRATGVSFQFIAKRREQVVNEKCVVLGFVDDDGIDLLICERRTTGHADFANRSPDAHYTNSLRWQQRVDWKSRPSGERNLSDSM